MYHYMKISPLLFSVFTLLGGSFVDAAKVENIQVLSAKMEKKIPATLILSPSLVMAILFFSSIIVD